LCYVFFVSQDYRVGRMRVVVDLTMFVFLLQFVQIKDGTILS